MHLYLGRLRRYWPWGLVGFGALIVIHTLQLLGEVHRRETLRWTGINTPLPSREFDSIVALASAGETKAALTACDQLRHRRGGDPVAARAIDMLRARVRVQCLGEPEATLIAFADSREAPEIWYTALDQVLDLRKARGDWGGAAAWLEEIETGRRRHPILAKAPFPYLQHWAAMEAARFRLKLADGKAAYAAARRAKYDYPCIIPDPMCSDPHQGFHDELETLLKDAARLQG